MRAALVLVCAVLTESSLAHGSSSTPAHRPFSAEGARGAHSLGFCAGLSSSGLGARRGGVLCPRRGGAQISSLKGLVVTKEEEDEHFADFKSGQRSTGAKLRGWPALSRKTKRAHSRHEHHFLPVLPVIDLKTEELLDRTLAADSLSSQQQQGEADAFGGLTASLYTPATNERSAIRSAAALDTLLNGVPVGHGIRCQSPLKLLTEGTLSAQPRLASVVRRIHHAAVNVAQSTNACQHIEFTEAQIDEVRSEVAAVYAEGEKRMTELAHLLALRLSEGAYECSSKVWATAADGLDFSLVEQVPAMDLCRGENSLSLAEKQLDAIRVQGRDEGWGNARMTDHSIEFESLHYNHFKTHRVIAHARPNGDVWKVITNSIFGIDHPDVPKPTIDEVNMFNMKIIAEDKEHAAKLYTALRTINFMDHELQQHNVEVSPESRRLELLAQDDELRTTTVRWNGAKMGIIILTLDEHYAESERLSMERRREQLAAQEHTTMELAEKSSVFGFSRDLLHWVLDPATFKSIPSCDRIRVSVH